MENYFLYRHAWRSSLAPHQEKKLDETQREELLHKGGLMVRNTYNFDQKEASHFWYVIKDRFDKEKELNTRDRNKVRHALNAFTFRTIPLETLRKEGYAIIAETYRDYPISDRKMNRTVFNTYLDECAKEKSDYWGIFEQDSDRLVGFGTVHNWDRCCEYGVTGILTRFKKNGTYPYYGLYHTLNQYYLEEKHYQYVSDGARTVTRHSHIQDFLIQHFGFRKAYCQLEVHYKWWMRIAVNALYPFRKIMPVKKVKALLNMEAMQRGKD